MDSGLEEEVPYDMVQGPPEPQDPVLKYLYDKALFKYKGVIPLKMEDQEGFGVPMYTPDGKDMLLIRITERGIPNTYNMDIPKPLVAGMIERVDETNHVADLVDPHTVYGDFLYSLNTETVTHYTVIVTCTKDQLALMQSNINNSRETVEQIDHVWNILDFLTKHNPFETLPISLLNE